MIVQGGSVGRLSRRFGDPKLFEVGLVALGLGLLAVPLTALAGLWPLLAALGVVAVGQGLIAPTGSALLSRSTDAAHQGEILGLAQSSSALARVFGPVVAGTVYQQLGDLAPFFLGGTVVLVAAWMAPKVPKPNKTGREAVEQGQACSTHL